MLPPYCNPHYKSIKGHNEENPRPNAIYNIQTPFVENIKIIFIPFVHI